MRNALMRYTAMLALLAIALPAQADSNWERLWFNADQRGEKLLQHGDANAAARIYKDPRRRAYAEMKAGDFKQAASELGNLHDSDSDYNRGNALAKMGDLKGALGAYDAALKNDPKNHDAQHNRDLVAQALQQQNGQQKNGQQQNGKSGGKQGNKANSSAGEQGKQAGQSGNGADNKNGQQSAENNSSQSGKNSSSGKDGGNQNAAAQQNTQQASSANNAQHNQQKNPGQSKDNADAQAGQGRNGATAANQQAAKPANPSANGQSADAAAQARKDAEAGLAARKPGSDGSRIASAASADQTAPLSEQQLSREQWLRSIPDDPGGLLRRKFMIEYMLRQQKAQQ